jgi:type I restriction enzyme S subunit
MTDWPVKTLGEVCEVLDSLRKPITKRDRIAGHYPYYGATGIVDYVADYIFNERLVLVGEDGAKWGAGERKLRL